MKVIREMLNKPNSGIVVKLEYKATENKNGKKIKSVSKCSNFITINTPENNEKKIRIFDNLEIAKLIVSERNNPAVENATYYIYREDGTMIDVKKCFKDKNNVYHYFDKENDIKYEIELEPSKKILNYGYIIFENGDTERTEKAEGAKKRRKYFEELSDICNYQIMKNLPNWASRIILTKNEIVLPIRCTTAEIHIMTNSRLMDINQERKSKGNYAIPFNKGMDKFTTFFYYIAKERSEPIRFKGSEIGLEVFTGIIEDVKYYYGKDHVKCVCNTVTNYIGG